MLVNQLIQVQLYNNYKVLTLEIIGRSGLYTATPSAAFQVNVFVAGASCHTPSQRFLGGTLRRTSNQRFQKSISRTREISGSNPNKKNPGTHVYPLPFKQENVG